MGKKTSTVPKQEAVEAESTPDEESQAEAESVPEPEVKPLTMVFLNSELKALRQTVMEHSRQIADLQETLARKRKPVPNGKIQIVTARAEPLYRLVTGLSRTNPDGILQIGDEHLAVTDLARLRAA